MFGVLALLAYIAWSFLPALYFQNLFKQTEHITTPINGYRTVTDNIGAYNLEAKYLGNNKWTYSVTAQLPTSCDGAIVYGLVKESYPEQVTIQITPTRPFGDVICAQVIQNFSYNSTFDASEQAKVNMMMLYVD